MGRGNARLLAWEGEKTLTFTMTNALLSAEGVAILTGADLIRANGTDQTVKAHHTTTFTLSTFNAEDNTGNLDTGGVIMLPASDAKPIDFTQAGNEGMPVYGMLLDKNQEMSGIAVKATAVGTKEVGEDPNKVTYNTVTFDADLFKAGDTIMLDYYSEHRADAIQIDITPDQFAGYYYIEGSTLFRRESDGYDLPAELIIPRGKIQSNFTFTFASTGDPSTFDFTVDAFPGYVKSNPAKQVLATIQILDADDNYDLTSGATEDEVTYKRYVYNQDGVDNDLIAYLGTTQEGSVTKSTAIADQTAAPGSDDTEAEWA